MTDMNEIYDRGVLLREKLGIAPSTDEGADDMFAFAFSVLADIARSIYHVAVNPLDPDQMKAAQDIYTLNDASEILTDMYGLKNADAANE